MVTVDNNCFPDFGVQQKLYQVAMCKYQSHEYLAICSITDETDHYILEIEQLLQIDKLGSEKVFVLTICSEMTS